MKLFGGLSLPGAGMPSAPPISRGPAQPPMQSRGYYERKSSYRSLSASDTNPYIQLKGTEDMEETEAEDTD